MENFNIYRVTITVLGLLAAGYTVLCPWWRYREVDNLMLVVPRAEAIEATLVDADPKFTGFGSAMLETRVGVIPLWDVKVYEVHDWLGFNVIQMIAVLSTWGLAMRSIPDLQRIGAARGYPMRNSSLDM